MGINVFGATAPKLDLFCHFSLVFTTLLYHIKEVNINNKQMYNIIGNFVYL